MDELVGNVINILYNKNNYCIFKLKVDGKSSVTVVGNSLNIYENQRLKIKGQYEHNKKFGLQFKMDEYEELKITNSDEIVNYLSSGIFIGIGRKTAEKIVAKFGEDTLDILEGDINKLKEVEGIGDRRLAEIKNSYLDKRTLKDIVMKLSKYGINIQTCNNIYKKFGARSIEIINTDPYILIENIRGMGFKKTDELARKLNISYDCESRVRAAILHVIKESTSFGNTFMFFDELVDKSNKILEIDVEIISKNIHSLVLDGILINQKFEDRDKLINAVFLSNIYKSEYEICSKLIRLYVNSLSKIDFNLNEEIDKFEKDNKIYFSNDQIKAIKGVLSNGIHIITGGPGTGKTTIIKFILDIFNKLGLKTIMAAPTGRAAKRMTESTGFEAKTIHRLLEINHSDLESSYEFAGKNEESPIECDVIILDEASMIDAVLASKLLKAIKLGTRLIIVGDVEQLPSIGPGNFLKDIINSNVFEISKLNDIYRQKENSYIILNAHKINSGLMPLANKPDSDFYILREKNEDKIRDVLLELLNFRLPQYFNNIDRIKDIQVLSPCRKGTLGVENLNRIIQDSLNPKDGSKLEYTVGNNMFRVGDKVIQTKNNYELKWKSNDLSQGSGVYNGDIGYIVDINQDDSDNIISVMYDNDKIAFYSEDYLDELEHAYSITIHKSQGSEFPVVIMPIFNMPNILLNRNILYTAITRAKKFLVIVGDYDIIKYMINNKILSKRQSSLIYLLNKFNELTSV